MLAPPPFSSRLNKQKAKRKKMADMFGGMTTTGGGRRKKGDAGAAPPAKAGGDGGSSANLAELAAQQAKQDQEQRDAALRARLERFYGYYNPGKLEAIDKTVDMFRGNEQKLWEMLSVKYGPDPTDEQIKRQQAEREAKEAKDKAGAGGKNMQLRRRATTSATATVDSAPTQSTAPVPNDSFAGFGDASGAGETAAAWGAADASAGAGSAGWGDNAGGGFGDAGGGFSFDGSGAAAAGDGAGGFGFGGGDGGGDGGFSFGGAAVGGADGAADGGGFGFGAGTAGAAATEAGGGFGFGAAAGGGEAAGGFGFTSESQPPPPAQQQQNAHASKDIDDADADDDARSDKSGDSDDGVVEKIDKRVSKALESLTTKRDTLADVLRRLTEAVAGRRKALAECAQLEALVDDYTNKEQFEKAEETHGRLQEAAARVRTSDDAWLSGSARLEPLAEELRAAVNASSRTFSEERSTLVQVRAEEERKIKSYITDATHKVETAATRIKVDLDKAVRAQSHVEQDLEELVKRKRDIESKIEEQTKGLRSEKEKIETDAGRLADEIADLEKLLATKRRQLADKNTSLEDINHKLELVNKNHQEVMNSVLDSMKEEELNLRVCKSRVEDVTEQKRANEGESAALQEEKRVMTRELEQHAGKIALLERLAQTLATEVSIGFGSFFKKVVRAATEVRGKEGRFCLMVPYTVPGAEDEGAAAAAATADSSSTSSDAAAASAALQALKAQLARLSQQLNLKTDEDAMLCRRLQDINRSIPALEAAKKQAAAAKQFKEAGAKTAELKALSEEKDDIAAKSAALADEQKALKRDIDKLEAQKLAETKRFRASMRNFTDRYSATLRAAASVAESADALSLLGVSGMLDAAAAASPAAAEADAQALRAAVKALIDALFAELAEVCETPEEQLRADPAAAEGAQRGGTSPLAQNAPGALPSSGSASSLDAGRHKSPSPAGGDAAGAAGSWPSPDATDREDAGAAAGWGDNAGAAAAWGSADAPEAAAAAAAPAAPALSKEEMQQKLHELGQKMEEAMGREDYDLCEELQQQINSLEEDIAKA